MLKELYLKKISSIAGQVTLPGSKSLTNRALLLAALAKGQTSLLNVLDSDDSKRMLEALESLGVKLNRRGSAVSVIGLGGGFDIGINQVELDLGNAGTAMRPLCAVLAGSRGSFKLTGEPRMLERPIGPLSEALKEIGLNIEYLNNPGFPPLQIRGKSPSLHQVSIDGSVSSQFITALLMAAPILGGLQIKIKGELISKPYVDLTISLMHDFGVEVKRIGYSSFEVPACSYQSPQDFFIEGDASNASYFAAAAAIAGRVEIYGLHENSTQGDAQFFKVLEKMGAQVAYGENCVTIQKQELNGIEIDMNAMPDAAMTLVPMAMFTKGPMVIKNIGSWRVKETDRIDALATQMRKLGVKVETGADFIAIDALQRNSVTPSFATYNDHRMAMSLSLIALDRDIIIEDPNCVSKTFPNYFNVLSGVCH